MTTTTLPAPAIEVPRPSLVASEALPAWRGLAFMAALVFLLAAALGFAFDTVDLPVMTMTLAAIVALAVVLRRRGFARVAALLECATLILAASMATACLSVLVATTALPYRDGALIRADRWLFDFSWRDMFLALHDQSRLIAVMSRIYASLLWQPFALVALLALGGRAPVAYRFVHAWVLALIACVAIFPLVPAVGAYVHYGLTPADIPALDVMIGWRQVEVLAPIRAGTMRLLSPAAMTGMISFPSFHAAGSVLLFWGFRRVPVIGLGFMALDIAMCLTAPLIGSHYFIDILGGIVVAVVAIAATRTRAVR